MKIPKPIRIQMIINFIKENAPVTMQQILNLADENNVPRITARRDVSFLLEEKKIKKEFGFFQITNLVDMEVTRDQKKLINVDKKNKIADYLISKQDLWQNTNCIFLGSGTTIEKVVEKITIPIEKMYTYGLEVARESGRNDNFKSINILGGEYRPKSHAICGQKSLAFIENLTFSLSIFSATHILDNGFIYNNNDMEALIIKKVIENSQKVIFLLDSSKFFVNVGGVKVIESEKVDFIITDNGIIEKKEYKNFINKMVNLIITE